MKYYLTFPESIYNGWSIVKEPKQHKCTVKEILYNEIILEISLKQYNYLKKLQDDIYRKI